MSIKANKLKKNILKSGEKIGIVVVKGSKSDRAITRSTTAAATLVNSGEKQFHNIASSTKSGLDVLRAKVHAATAPRERKK